MLEASKSGILYLLCWRKLLITDTAPGWADKQSPGKFTVITSLPVSRGEKRVRQDLNIWVISGLSLTPPAWVDQVGWCNSNTNPGTCGLSDWFKNSSLSALTLTMFLYDTLNHFTELTTQKRENFNYVAEILQNRCVVSFSDVRVYQARQARCVEWEEWELWRAQFEPASHAEIMGASSLPTTS